MQKKIYPSEIVRIKRLKKFLKKSKSVMKRSRKQKSDKAEENRNKFVISPAFVTLPDAVISNQMATANVEISPYKNGDRRSLCLPETFDIFSDPESVLKALFKYRNILLDTRLASSIIIDHRKVKNNSLGSEVLLGLLVSEIINHRRKSLKDKLSLKGLFPKDKTAKQLIQSVGLAKEIGDDHFKDAADDVHGADVHLFRYDNRHHQSVSVKNDKKRKAAEDCVQYLDRCMNAHKLTIKEEAKNRLVACLGEVIDNATEHCGLTKPIWYVRGYFNDQPRTEGRFLELSVFNFGNSIFDNFNNLPKSSEIKGVAAEYVNRHSKVIDTKALYTVAALQGNISSKRDTDKTRGQGSVTLIETFESIYSDYCRLRKPTNSSTTTAEMNIISGDTVIKFDGKYKSIVEESEGGSERFKMPFNIEGSLESPPDSNNIYKMKDVSFPGVMINIRIPLQGSTEPLEGKLNG